MPKMSLLLWPLALALLASGYFMLPELLVIMPKGQPQLLP